MGPAGTYSPYKSIADHLDLDAFEESDYESSSSDDSGSEGPGGGEDDGPAISAISGPGQSDSAESRIENDFE
jgi:hypothetical protein